MGLLNAQTEYPEFVQIRLVRNKDDPFSVFPVPVLNEYFRSKCGRILLQFGVDKQFLSSPFHIFYCVESYIRDAYPNNALATLTRGVDPRPRAWPGTIVVLKLADVARAEYVDMCPQDLLHVREYFAYVQ